MEAIVLALALSQCPPGGCPVSSYALPFAAEDYEEVFFRRRSRPRYELEGRYRFDYGVPRYRVAPSYYGVQPSFHSAPVYHDDPWRFRPRGRGPLLRLEIGRHR